MNTTNQGVNVGATATSVGDFSTQLPGYQTDGRQPVIPPPDGLNSKIPTLPVLPGAGVAGRLAFPLFC